MEGKNKNGFRAKNKLKKGLEVYQKLKNFDDLNSFKCMKITEKTNKADYRFLLKFVKV